MAAAADIWKLAVPPTPRHPSLIFEGRTSLSAQVNESGAATHTPTATDSSPWSILNSEERPGTRERNDAGSDTVKESPVFKDASAPGRGDHSKSRATVSETLTPPGRSALVGVVLRSALRTTRMLSSSAARAAGAPPIGTSAVKTTASTANRAARTPRRERLAPLPDCGVLMSVSLRRRHRRSG